MRIPDNDSLLWPLGTMLVLIVLLTYALWANYNGLDQRDIHTVIEVCVGYLVWWLAKRKLRSINEKESDDARGKGNRPEPSA